MKQPVIDDQSDMASSVASIDGEETVDKHGRSRVNRVHRQNHAQSVAGNVVYVCTPRLTHLCFIIIRYVNGDTAGYWRRLEFG